MFSQVVTALTRVVRQTHFISQKILCFVIEFVQLRVVALVPRPGPTLCGAAVLLCRGQLRPGWSSNQNSDASTLRHTRRDGMTWCDCRAFSPLLCLAWTNIRFYCRFGRGEKQTVLWKHLCVCVYVLMLCLSRLRRMWCGKRQEEQAQSNGTEEIEVTCADFVKRHQEQCFHDIARKRRWENLLLSVFHVKGNEEGKAAFLYKSTFHTQDTLMRLR